MLEFFYLLFLGNFGFCGSKKIIISGCVHAKIFISWGNIEICVCYQSSKFHNFIWHWSRARIFLMEKFVFFDSKKFFISGCVHAKIFISWGIVGEYTYHHQSMFHNFSLHWRHVRIFLVSIIGFCENEKFLSQGVCKINFLFLEGI